MHHQMLKVFVGASFHKIHHTLIVNWSEAKVNFFTTFLAKEPSESYQYKLFYCVFVF